MLLMLTDWVYKLFSVLFVFRDASMLLKRVGFRACFGEIMLVSLALCLNLASFSYTKVESLPGFLFF